MKSLVCFIALFAVVSCSTHTKEDARIKEILSEETQINDAKDLEEYVISSIDHSKDLSDAEKKKLHQILQDTKKKNTDLTHQSLKLRAHLVKELTKKPANEKEIKLIKNRIREIESHRMENSFQGIDMMSAILHKAPEKKQILERMTFMDRFY